MQAEYKQYKYKVVNLQNLQRKKQFQSCPTSLQKLVDMLDKPTKEQFIAKRKGINKSTLSFEEKLYLYKDTAVDQNRVMKQFNNFFNAFYCPYSMHGDVFLVPDDIWLAILLYLSKYIDSNAEKLRSHFVKHEGQKQLTIIEVASSIEQSLKKQKQWDYFFTEIIKKIQQNTVEGVVQALSCNFSTTDQVYKLISTSAIMSSFKQYFSYGRAIMMCGLNNIYFAGNREDWIKLQLKLKNLQKYDVDGKFKQYVKNMEVILKNFIETFDEKPNLQWWNKIMTTEERRVGSGGQKDTYIQGWILHFYGIYEQVEVQKIPKTLISVPIKMINQWTNTEKKLQLISDWVSVSKVNETTYKPDIGVCIIEKERKKLKEDN